MGHIFLKIEKIFIFWEPAVECQQENKLLEIGDKNVFYIIGFEFETSVSRNILVSGEGSTPNLVESVSL
jgi:hypothetical protein